MKKNSKHLDYLIGTLWCNKFYTNEIIYKIVIGIEYYQTDGNIYNTIIAETMNGQYAGDSGQILETDFFNYHKEIT